MGGRLPSKHTRKQLHSAHGFTRPPWADARKEKSKAEREAELRRREAEEAGKRREERRKKRDTTEVALGRLPDSRILDEAERRGVKFLQLKDVSVSESTRTIYSGREKIIRAILEKEFPEI